MTAAIFGNERGSVMNIALLILILLTLIVIYMSRSATTDLAISINKKSSTTAFLNADAGAYSSAKIVGRALELMESPEAQNGGGADYPQVAYINPGGGAGAEPAFFDKVFTETDENAANLLSPAAGADLADFDTPVANLLDNAPGVDIQFLLNNRKVNVGIARTGSQNLAGGGAEFGAGDRGVGSGSAGGVAVSYTARAMGQGPKNSRAEVIVEYRKIPGTVGGL